MHAFRHQLCVTMDLFGKCTKYGTVTYFARLLYLTIPPKTWDSYMALKFAANLSFTFLENANFLNRYKAAKNAGNVHSLEKLS